MDRYGQSVLVKPLETALLATPARALDLVAPGENDAEHQEEETHKQDVLIERDRRSKIQVCNMDADKTRLASAKSNGGRATPGIKML